MNNISINKRCKFKAIGLWPFICFLLVLVGLLIVGSFFDLNISQTIFKRGNGFGIFVSSIAIMPAMLGGIMASGIMISFVFRNKEKDRINVIKKILLCCYAICMLIGFWYYIGHQISGVNGYNMGSEIYGALIASPFALSSLYFGFRVGKKRNNKKLLFISIMYGILLLITALGITTFLKTIMSRPRYRALTDEATGLTIDDFCSWWQPFKYHEGLNILSDSEEFKSFPSGHTTGATSSILFVLYLSLLFPKLGNKRMILFIIGCLWTFLVAFSRILVGAHFLSDTMFAAIYTTIFILIFNIFIEKKLVDDTIYE